MGKLFLSIKEYPASKNLNEEINKQFNYTKRYRQKLFNEDCAIYGDVYMYDGEKLIFVCSGTPEPKRKTWFGKSSTTSGVRRMVL